jgi:hypothetical protein
MSKIERITQHSNQLETIIQKANQQIPRISASDVAAIANFNPWKSPADLIDKYLYQDCDELFQLDSKNLNLVVLTEEEEVDHILSKLPGRQRVDMSSIKTRIERGEMLVSSSACDMLLRDARGVLADPASLECLSKEEVDLVMDRLRSGAHTGSYTVGGADV